MVLQRTLVSRGFGALGSSGGGAIASPTLAVADNGDGTGAVATITGSENGSVTNTVYVWDGDSWEDSGDRTGNGTVSLSLAIGKYWAYVQSDDGASFSLSNLVRFAVTDSDLGPVIERIADEIEHRLQQVTTGNGYSMTFSVVRPPARGVNKHAPGRCVLTQATGDELVGYTEGNPAAVIRRQTFYIDIHVAAVDDDTTPVDNAANLAAADAEHALSNEQTAGDWAQFEGLAQTCEQTGREISNDGTFRIVSLTYAVQYRTDENDPYTVR